MTDRERAQALAWLATPPGTELLRLADALPADRLTRLARLRRQVSPEIAAVAVELLELRKRARAKFTGTDTLFFTPEGLEQSTGEAVARYHAARFPVGLPVLDACCGIGGDARALAARGPVVAVDHNPAALACARQNTVKSARGPAYFLCADVTRLDFPRLAKAGIVGAFLDPSRRIEDERGERRRARNAEDYQPPLSWLATLREHFSLLGVKVSPAIPDEALARYNSEASIEFISERGECKECVLWFQRTADHSPVPRPAKLTGYSATVLRPDQPPVTLSASPSVSSLETSTPRAWLYEPDPAVIRAHLHTRLAEMLTLYPLDHRIAYLTGDAFVPTPFATAYRIVEWLPFHLKNIQARLRALNAHVAVVKKRGVPFAPEDIQKRLTPTGSRALVLVLTHREERPIALLCDPPEVEG